MTSKMRLFQVSLDRGRSHPESGKWVTGVMNLNGKAPDYGGLNNLALVASGGDEAYIHAEVTNGMKTKYEKDVSVEEVTKNSLIAKHSIWTEVVEGYFSFVDLQ